MAKIELIATAAFGLEAVVAKELKVLGYTDQLVENGRVTFWGDEEAICRTNLWLRSADRVLLKMGEFNATTFEELFEQTKALPWADLLPQDAEFPVDGKSIKSKLFSVSDCQAIVKKAIVEKIKQRYKQSWFAETGPRYKIEVGLLKDRATLTVDTSGAGLHKRGYRELTTKAPLRETLAAALVRLSNWPAERVLADPLCGSGTIPIEAAMLALNLAPGLNRRFVAESWPNLPAKLWEKGREEARSVARRERSLRIFGTDLDEKVLSLARHHARKAGVEKYIHFQQLPLAQFRSRYEHGYIICNPPYGERLGEVREAEVIYREIRQLLAKHPSWSLFLLTSHLGFEQIFGRPASKKRKLYNGRIQCNYYLYHGPEPKAAERDEQA
ncbi:MAG: class I SAM-dependent RNA methyltransferase [Dethiobacter sp.]|jgi:putative N6-adenine-specific DNA methylase|nr:class I SAM-dependent RNA methyltransferase [Dethiobacter sp.]MBS3897604.1 class I SAM-dependent RNA methyltransferase [Dethiobacter sp.]MBS3983089.1 class I SAM-dependent RNA methyltransferase [Dethiobacter sp.]MCL4463268.1 class I SAM-dependent RNA methyltransferase [Bacillota bacterium]MCL5993017.1 class I SAM-dependent RNA methyltransferase [Bacillota bacterium]